MRTMLRRPESTNARLAAPRTDRRGPLVYLVLGAALLGGAGAAAAFAADDEEVERRISDQAQIFDRIVSLKAKMERLAEKLEQQERPYKAQLLREALKEIDERGVTRQKDAVLDQLRSRNLQVAETQTKLLADLENIYRILLDQSRER